MVKNNQDNLVNEFITLNPLPGRDVLEKYDEGLDDYVYESVKLIYSNPFRKSLIVRIGECLSKKGGHKYVMRVWLLLALIFKQSGNQKVRSYPNLLNRYWSNVLKAENLL